MNSNVISIPVNAPNAQETFINVEQRADGWWSCVSGTNMDGLYFESEDSGPFATQAAAEQDARDYLTEYHRDDPAR